MEIKKPIVRSSINSELNTAVSKLIEIVGETTVESAYVYNKDPYVDLHFRKGFFFGGKDVEAFNKLGFEIRMVTDLESREHDHRIETVVGFGYKKP